MTPEELEKKLGDLESQVDQLTKQAEQHGLTVEKADDGSVSLAKAKTEEYVTVGGEQIAKSQVPAGILKAIEDQQTQLTKMQQEREAESLRKRAQSEVPNLAGSDDAKGSLLKAIDAMPDEHRDALTKALKAADAAVSKQFEEVGKSVADDESSATYQLEKRVQARMEKNGEDYHTAYAEVTKAGEGKTLMQKSRAETRGAAN